MNVAASITLRRRLSRIFQRERKLRGFRTLARWRPGRAETTSEEFASRHEPSGVSDGYAR